MNEIDLQQQLDLDAEVTESEFEAIAKMRRDLRDASRLMSRSEARFLVDSYYQTQRSRIRATLQAKQCSKTGEPHAVLAWQVANMKTIEGNIKAALGVFAKEYTVGKWAMSICGVGPVIAAGLLANFDIRRAPHIGHYWSFAGCNPRVEWQSSAELSKRFSEFPAEVDLAGVNEMCNMLYRSRKSVTDKLGLGESYKKADVIKLLAHRPWSPMIKSLVCFKLGESFVKMQGRPKDIYGVLFGEYKQKLWQRNLDGELTEHAAEGAARVGKGTVAYKWYNGDVSKGWATAMLKDEEPWPPTLPPKATKGRKKFPMIPPAHVHAWARRYTAKMFLSHLHSVSYEDYYGKKGPEPWITSKSEDADKHTYDAPPNWPMTAKNKGKDLTELLVDDKPD